MSKIKLAENLSISAADLATEVVASLGQRGSGKSNGAGVIAEGLLAAGVQVVVLDHVGIWFSLRLDGTGKHPSPFAIPVLGGQHGDIALVATTGAVVAEALARSGSSAVLDVSAFSKGDRCRFAADFAEAFFAAKKLHPGPVQILLEEAQRYVPQKLFAGQGLERMLGAFEEIAEVGRNYGVGLHLISQRPQKINKDVLNLADTVLAYRANGVLERKAISDWVQEKGAEGRKEMHNELPGLPRGTAIVWSPNREIYDRFAVIKKSTYDAGATPTHAREAVKTKRLDLESLESAMGKAVEEAKANDPRVLRARVAELERQIAHAAPAATREVQVIPPAILELGQRLQEAVLSAHVAIVLLDSGLRDMRRATESLEHELDYIQQSTTNLAKATGEVQKIAVAARPRPAPAIAARVARAPIPSPRADLGQYAMTKSARAVLTALAQNPGGLTRRKLGIMSGYAPAGTSMREALALCRKATWVDDLVDGTIKITDFGLRDLGSYTPLPTGAALRDYWFGELPTGAARILRAVCNARPRGLTKEEIADATTRDGGKTAYQAGGTSMREALAMLRGLEIVDDVGDRIVAAEALF